MGAIAVVLSLWYLAIQIRNQNSESRIAAIYELRESFRNAITSFQNAELADVFVRAKDGLESLPEAERLQLNSMIQGVFRVWQDAFHQLQESRLPKRMWQATVTQFSSYLSLSGVMSIWEIRKMAYSEDLPAFVDETTPLEYKSM